MSLWTLRPFAIGQHITSTIRSITPLIKLFWNPSIQSNDLLRAEVVGLGNRDDEEQP